MSRKIIQREKSAAAAVPALVNRRHDSGIQICKKRRLPLPIAAVQVKLLCHLLCVFFLLTIAVPMAVPPLTNSRANHRSILL